MFEFLHDISLVLGRVITILPLLLFITLFMGKRAIGELPVFDFLIIVILGAIAGADIADPNIKHLPTAIAIIGVGVLQRVVAKWKISNRKIGRWLTFEPTIIIQDGKFLDNNLKKIRYSIDNILQMLREKNVFDIREVETAIIEANGALSVLKKPQKNTVTLEDMNIIETKPKIAFAIIIEGTLYTNVLKEFNLDEKWLDQQLYQLGIKDIEEVFFASINQNHELHISLYDEKNVKIPQIRH
ncbi:DUF421 domain-containing protein [Gracilibacillus saliphilus]|uniref:DUF421 domain-containing protein n=1 Tax=Gracilibacillus saliphilus TaxID=543890 RepID=UPI0013D3CC54|nr:DUF421 domain-containing protein [Gracilibacillus saliphilus]